MRRCLIFFRKEDSGNRNPQVRITIRKDFNLKDELLNRDIPVRKENSGLMIVYVKSRNGKPLMPTSPPKARVLMKQGKAKCIRKNPFTIKLLYKTTEYVQECTLAVDTGSGTLGSAAVTDDGKVLYLSEVEERNDIKKGMDDRRKYRRNRRNRKTRYRKPRFDNRKNSKRKDRLPPTVVSKIHAHEKEIAFVRNLLPCKKDILVLETGTFDTHLMKNPYLRNENVVHWGYQKGKNYGYANTKAYVLARDGYQCQYCKAKKSGTKLEVHHIIFRSQGGSDDEENLITLCEPCHTKLHAGVINPSLKGKRKGILSFATQMNVIRARLLKAHPEAVETFGYVTKENRQALSLPKTHCIDAAVAASGGEKLIFLTDTVIRKKCISDGDFQKTKGIRSEQHIETGKICGFRKFDRVRYYGKEYFIKGRMSTGYAFLTDIHGEKADFSHMPRGMKTPKLKDCKRIAARTTWMITEEPLTLNTA